jgi:hypothetical protein
MRPRLALVLAVLSLAAAPVGSALAAPTSARHHVIAIAAKSCSAGFRRGVIGGAVKCLRRGEYCAVRYRSQYRRYGYACSGRPARLH